LNTHLTGIDAIIIVVYLVVLLGVGWLFSHRQTSLKEYFLAGRSMGWLVVLLSIFATGFSAIAYVGSPGVAYEYDLMYFSMMLNMPLVALVILFVLMPFFYKLGFYTAYQYLERRFDLKTRSMASGLFLLLRGFLTATGIYAASIVLTGITGWPQIVSILIIGVITTIYTAMGGIKAVMINDNIQFCIVNTGALIALAIMFSRIDGGLGEVLRVAADGGRLRMFDWSFHLYGGEYATNDSWNCIFGIFFANLAMFGIDQTIIQRNLTCKSYKTNIKVIIWTPIICMVLSFVFYFIGTVIYAFYQQFPDRISPDIPGDHVFIHFILSEMPVGLRGLMVTAIFAAAMSVLSSALNSLATVTIVDFVQRFKQGDALGAASAIVSAKALTCFWGLFATGMAVAWVYMGGLRSVLENAINIGNFFSGPLLGMFLAGMLFRRFSANGAFYGAILGFLLVCWSEFAPALFSALGWAMPAPIQLTTGIHPFWYGALGFFGTWLAGWLISLFEPAPADVAGLVVGDVVNAAAMEEALGRSPSHAAEPVAAAD